LSADDWDNQLLFFRDHGFRVIAHDRRGHGRSDQPDFGNDMDTYVADLAELTDYLDLKNAIHVGHSTGGGEVARYVARAKPERVSKAVLISAIPPVMVRKQSNPNGTPVEVFDGFRAALAANRSEFYVAIASGPFYNFDKPGVEKRDGLIRNWWRQGMMSGANAGYDCIRVFSETDFTEALADEGKEHGIRAIVLYPGAMATNWGPSRPMSGEKANRARLRGQGSWRRSGWRN
jgi:non-heme chloroperoxidase